MIAAPHDRFDPSPLPRLAYVHTSDGQVRAIWPKSPDALAEFLRLDAALGSLAAAQLQYLAAIPDISPALIASEASAHALRVWLWIVASPTTDLPFANDVEPPTWTHAVPWPDVLALGAAFLRVNGTAIAVVRGGGPSDASLAAESLLAVARALT